MFPLARLLPRRPPCGRGRAIAKVSVPLSEKSVKLTSTAAHDWGVRHGLQLPERRFRLLGGNPFTRLTQVPKGARDGASREAHPPSGRIAPLRRGGRQKLG